jgi:hypothetical protein
MALRLLAFKQVFKILGMEPIVYQSQNNSKFAKKRQHEDVGDEGLCFFFHLA